MQGFVIQRREEKRKWGGRQGRRECQGLNPEESHPLPSWQRKRVAKEFRKEEYISEQKVNTKGASDFKTKGYVSKNRVVSVK